MSNTDNSNLDKPSATLDDVFLNMSALVAHRLVLDGIRASIPHDVSKLRQVCLSRNTPPSETKIEATSPTDDSNDSLNM